MPLACYRPCRGWWWVELLCQMEHYWVERTGYTLSKLVKPAGFRCTLGVIVQVLARPKHDWHDFNQEKAILQAHPTKTITQKIAMLLRRPMFAVRENAFEARGRLDFRVRGDLIYCGRVNSNTLSQVYQSSINI